MSGIYWSEGIRVRTYSVAAGKRRPTVVKIELTVEEGSWELDGLLRQLAEHDAKARAEEEAEREEKREAALLAKRSRSRPKLPTHEPLLMLEDRRTRR